MDQTALGNAFSSCKHFKVDASSLDEVPPLATEGSDLNLLERIGFAARCNLSSFWVRVVDTLQP